jgi:hypothetical protein
MRRRVASSKFTSLSEEENDQGSCPQNNEFILDHHSLASQKTILGEFVDHVVWNPSQNSWRMLGRNFVRTWQDITSKEVDSVLTEDARMAVSSVTACGLVTTNSVATLRYQKILNCLAKRSSIHSIPAYIHTRAYIHTHIHMHTYICTYIKVHPRPREEVEV